MQQHKPKRITSENYLKYYYDVPYEGKTSAGKPLRKLKKAKETIKRSETNLLNAKNELKQYQEIYDNFINSNEKEADKIVEIYGNKNKKKEVAKTIFNRPFSKIVRTRRKVCR